MLEPFSKIPRNTLLLLVLLALFLVSPTVSGSSEVFIIELMFDGVLIAGVYSAGEGRGRWGFWLLTLITLAYRWGELFFGDTGATGVGALALTVVWLVVAIWIVVAQLFRERHVTLDAIMGAVVTYLLSAIAFGIVFEIMELEQPGSFSGLSDEAMSSRARLVSSMMYFSLVCITTMGFGDIVPVSPVARPVAALEGMYGQLYLAVMIARLVGLHLVSEPRT